MITPFSADDSIPVSRMSDKELETLLERVFPYGFDGQDVWAELAPEGWPASPLSAVFHPGIEQIWEETVRLHRTIERLCDQRNHRQPRQLPTLAEIEAEHEDTPYEPDREIRDLLGMCLWDVFSDNHEVIAPDGRIADLGSFRGAAAFIANYLNAQMGQDRYDYLHYYMGSVWVSGRADLTSVYELIFGRLLGLGYTWRYHFPRLCLINLRDLHSWQSTEIDEPDWLSYSPSEALLRRKEQQEEDQDVAELQQDLDEAYRHAVEEACSQPPPCSVEAYRRVYGQWPEGWPPKIEW